MLNVSAELSVCSTAEDKAVMNASSQLTLATAAAAVKVLIANNRYCCCCAGADT